MAQGVDTVSQAGWQEDVVMEWDEQSECPLGPQQAILEIKCTDSVRFSCFFGIVSQYRMNEQDKQTCAPV